MDLIGSLVLVSVTNGLKTHSSNPLYFMGLGIDQCERVITSSRGKEDCVVLLK